MEAMSTDENYVCGIVIVDGFENSTHSCRIVLSGSVDVDVSGYDCRFGGFVESKEC